MLNEPTMEKLYEMRLSAMADAWMAQQKDATIGALSFDERMALLVEAEHMARDNRRLRRLLKDAELRIPSACMEDVKASPARGMEKAMVRQLGSCTWIGEHLNVLITGATGVGKSYLASALGQAACRKGLRVMYRRVPRLFDELALARVDGSYARVLSKLAKAELLILDDLGLGTPTESQRNDLLEVLEDRYGRASTVVTSQLEQKKWHEWIGEPTIADAILDRLVHNAYKLNLAGASGRKEKGTDKN
ncbi:MAG TPA: IS21-like element helper ATPase IstB [Polyangiales bacterium]|nr:IS21-like element helper ATPase IstB [Polyangiales bacterium]